MATMSAQGTLPAAGNPKLAAPITDTINHIMTTYNGNNIDVDNVDYTSADGIMVLNQAQTRTAALTVTADITYNDNVRATFGTGGDADIYYDATNLVIDPDVVGSGVVKFLGAINVGVDDTGHDVKFFGATSGSYLLWDESADQMILTVPTSTTPTDGDFAFNQTATATGDLLGMSFCQDGTISRTRAAVYSVAENDSGTGLSLAFFTRLAVDATQLQATDERMRIDSSGNVLIGATAKGTGAAGVLTIANGTQGAALANAVQIVSKDLSAGNTQLSVQTEGGGAVSASVATASTHKFAIEIDGTQYYLLMTT